MAMVFDDSKLRVDVDEDISAIGKSLSQTLTRGILFTIKSPNGKMIQFKSRTLKWLEGPQVNNYVTDISGYSKPDALDWDVDVMPRKAASKKSPYYDDGGACSRTETETKIGDQPGVDHTKNFLFEEGKKFDEMGSHSTKDKFRGISIIIFNNHVTHKVEWSRTGKGDGSYYKVAVTSIDAFPENLKTVLITKNYDITGL
ncbi:hypothetical protein ACXR0M_08410 [Pseudomonas sp. Eth.TT006]